MKAYFLENPNDAIIVGVALNIDSIFGFSRASKVLHETTDETKREQTIEPLEVAPPESIITRWFGSCGQDDSCSHSCSHCSHSCSGHASK